MDIFKKTSLLLLFMLSSLLFGCEENPEPVLSEKQVATAFFNAIYNEKNLEKAMSLSSHEFKLEMEKYHTVHNVARHLFSMTFDSVALHTSAQKKQILDGYHVQVTMTVQFTGKRDGSNYKDYKKIQLVKEDNVWLVDKLLEYK